jgi:hypothetical protein
MDVVVTIEQKKCLVSISTAAESELAKRDGTVVAEIVVTLACCIRKTVHFRDAHINEHLLLATPQLAVKLISAEHRALENDNDHCLPPIKNWNALAPRWITIDYRAGTWLGDFGYSSSGLIH